MKNLSLFSLLLLSMNASAWSHHALSTYVALKDYAHVSKVDELKVESLESFVVSMREPLSLAFPELRQNLNRQQLKLAFLRAMKISTKAKYRNFVQKLPGMNVPGTVLDKSQVSTIRGLEMSGSFVEVKDGSLVSPFTALVSYVDEPDYGLDIGLFSDNTNSQDGKRYGFGPQPWGDPALEYGSQAPFHMGFFFEASAVYALKPSVSKTWVLYRIQQFSALSRLAIKNGHPYWGYRFFAWALHYVQDLTQPYHSTLAPGHSSLQLLTKGFLDKIGHSAPVNGLLREVSDLHGTVETYQFQVLDAHLAGRAVSKQDLPVVIALTNSFRPASDDLSDEESFARYVAGQSNGFSDDLARGLKDGDFRQTVVQLMELLGDSTRNFLTFISF